MRAPKHKDPRTIGVLISHEDNEKIQELATRRGLSRTRAMRLIAEELAGEAGVPVHFKVQVEAKDALMSLAKRRGRSLDELFSEKLAEISGAES